MSITASDTSFSGVLFEVDLLEREADKLLAGKLIPTLSLSWLPGLRLGTPLPSVWCPQSTAQVRHIKGQNSMHNLQILLLFYLKHQLQSAFCAQPAASVPPASAVHNLETILDLGYNFKWRNKHVANSTKTFGYWAACTAAVEVQVQNSVSQNRLS